MLRNPVMRAIAISALCLLGACADDPVQSGSIVQPQFSTAVGTTATWLFEGEIDYVWNGPYTIGAPVSGTVTFTVLYDDGNPDPCTSWQAAATRFTFIVNGTSRTINAIEPPRGAVITSKICGMGVPYLQVNATPNPIYAAIELTNNVDEDVFPVIPPPFVDWRRFFWIWDSSNGYDGFRAYLTRLVAVPGSKEACKNSGWQQYGFKNQGQCVRYIETGIDSR